MCLSGSAIADGLTGYHTQTPAPRVREEPKKEEPKKKDPKKRTLSRTSLC